MRAKKKQKASARNRQSRRDNRCVIPPPPVKHILKSYTILNPGNARGIARYVEWQARGEKVQHTEKIKTEHLLGRDYECWDVHTQRDRYWVITSPTNLYSQKLFPSLDYTLSFHIGVMIRVEAGQKGAPDAAQGARFVAVWRRWEEASNALDAAEEAEEFQAVGMRCRECLIQLVRSVGKPEMGAARSRCSAAVQRCWMGRTYCKYSCRRCHGRACSRTPEERHEVCVAIGSMAHACRECS